MPEWLDTPQEAFTILSLFAIVLSGLVWLIRAQIAQMRELKPNHGSSMRDAIDRIERMINEQHIDIREIRADVNRVHGRISDHIHDHATGVIK